MFAGQPILSSTEFQISLLLFVALAGYLISYRINQTAVVGIIVAGVAVGPSWLGLITYTDFVATLARFGAVVLLFTIGLEFQVKQIANIKYFTIALVGVLVPWVGGFYLARLFDFDSNASIFIGTTLTATSIAITAHVLKEMNKLQTAAAAQAIIGAAVIDDVLALLALSVSEQLVAGSISAVATLVVAAKATAFIAIGVFLGKALMGKILARLAGTRLAGRYPESIFIFAIMVAFFYAMVAELVGLSGIVGSFLAGISFAGVSLKRGEIFREGAEHLQVIFASIFFISLGVLMDFHMVTLNLLLFVLALTIVAIVTKVIGCGVPAKLMGMDFRDSLIVGVGMMPRGEVAMIVALIGLDQKLITQDTYTALILMSLLTTIILPLAARNWLFRKRAADK